MAIGMSDEELERQIKMECHRWDEDDGPECGRGGFILWCLGVIVLGFMLIMSLVKCF